MIAVNKTAVANVVAFAVVGTLLQLAWLADGTALEALTTVCLVLAAGVVAVLAGWHLSRYLP